MAVAPFSRLLPPPPADAPIRPALSRVRRLVPVRSSPPRLPSLLSFPPARRPRRFSAQGNGGPPEALEEAEAGEESKKQKEGGEEEEEGEKRDGAASAAASVAEELKEMMAARRKESSSSSSDLWAGVAEEVGEIEWPPFGKVLGTTGVVLAVIAGSSVALLTVNAILAEISDKVFAGKGIQDFL